MKLFDGGKAPNPRRVRIFLAEKGLTVPNEPLYPDRFETQLCDVDGDPAGQGPVLVLDDGTVITESLAICRYFEGIRPEPPLFGRPGKEEALVEMWNRRVELTLGPAVAAAFRNLSSAAAQTENEAEYREETCRVTVLAFLQSLDEELEDRLFIVSDHYTVADITALVSIDFVMPETRAMLDDLVNLRRWYAQVTARPSASA